MAVVGRFAGDTALAAVGSCVALVGIFVNLIVGLSVGPNAVLALLIGQNNREEINRTLHTVITFGTALGVGLMIVGWLTAKPILVLSGTPESVLDQALLYIFIYFLSIPFMLVYNFGSAVLRSYGDSRRPMYYLLISGTVNVILNLFLVIALQLGVAGVAIATVISNVLSAGMVLTHLARRNDDFAFRFRRMHIEKTPLLRILQIGIPAGIQGAIFSVSNVFIQSGINSFGENAIAGSSLALNFEYFTYDIANAFAQAAVTFTSQNYGAGDLRRCKKIFRYCMLFGVVFTEILSAVFMIWDDFFVNLHHEQRRRGVCHQPHAARLLARGSHRHLRGRKRGAPRHGQIARACHLHRARHGRFPTHLDGNDFPSRAHVRDADGRLRCLVGVHRRSAADHLSAAYAKGCLLYTSSTVSQHITRPSR